MNTLPGRNKSAPHSVRCYDTGRACIVVTRNLGDTAVDFEYRGRNHVVRLDDAPCTGEDLFYVLNYVRENRSELVRVLILALRLLKCPDKREHTTRCPLYANVSYLCDVLSQENHPWTDPG